MLSDTPWVYPIVLQFNIIVVYKQKYWSDHIVLYIKLKLTYYST